MTKELAKPVNKELEIPAELQGNWGFEVDSDDIVISRISVAQQMSDSVKADLCKAGDLFDSLSKRVLAKKGDHMAFVPIHSKKTWRIEIKNKNRYDFVRYEDFNSSNAHLPYEFQEGSDYFKRTKVMSFYVLLPQEIDDQLAGKSAAMPHQISFQNSGFSAGQKLSTEIAKGLYVKRPPAGTIYTLSTKENTNDKGTFYVPDVDVFGPTDVEYLKVAFEWHNILSSKKDKIVEAGNE